MHDILSNSSSEEEEVLPSWTLQKILTVPTIRIRKKLFFFNLSSVVDALCTASPGLLQEAAWSGANVETRLVEKQTENSSLLNPWHHSFKSNLEMNGFPKGL